MIGTVTYQSDNRQSVTIGSSNPMVWKVTRSGDFPKKCKIVSATLKISIAKSILADRKINVTRDSGETLGIVTTGASGTQEIMLTASANYKDIKLIKIQGVGKTSLQTVAGTNIIITVKWEDKTKNSTISTKATPPAVITGTRKTGESGRALHTDVTVKFDGVDISEPINAGLLNLTYTDNEEDEADDLQIKLQDRNGKWLDQWLNDTMQQAVYGIKKGTKGLTISAGVSMYQPTGIITSADFGQFELDELKASGPPSNILIKGTSLPYSNGVRTEERDKSWEKTNLKAIGEKIAKKAGLGFLYDCAKNPSYSRVEQAKQTDIAFLQQLCHDHGYSLKISGLKMIIFDQARYEQLEAVATIRWMDGTYIKYDLDTQDGDTHYDQCTVKYYDANAGKTYEATANAEDFDPDANERTVCTVTDRKVKNQNEAADLAAKILRLHNKYEKKCSFTLLGNPMIGAGMTMTLEGFGLWDEKYIIKQAKHEVGSNGYTTKVTLRTIPEGKVTTIKTTTEDKKETTSSGNGYSQKQATKTSSGSVTEPRTKGGTAIYTDSEGGQKSGFVVDNQKMTILGDVKDGMVQVLLDADKQKGEATSGWVSIDNIQYVDPDTPVGGGIKDTKNATIVNGQVVYTD